MMLPLSMYTGHDVRCVAAGFQSIPVVCASNTETSPGNVPRLLAISIRSTGNSLNSAN